ncbi:MAG: excinuclease ABC subunit UvrA, partial [Duodenibacillus sp.]|nr:excinuclease ABC subunit UvrA [Duodenibacillus sp.]
VTGVSGSGKSSLVNETVSAILRARYHRAKTDPLPCEALRGAELFDKVVTVDQSPIGRTPRSNPAIYTGLFQMIREVFAQTVSARERGYDAGRFSFNTPGGRCEACEGDGQIKIEMGFLPPVYTLCQSCMGRRYNRETLEVQYKGRSIADVLAMTVSEAMEFFSAWPQIVRKLQGLSDVGLGYIRLGQSAVTFSGGEAQRIKLAEELGRRDTGRTLYILDEPTTGLHFDDVAALVQVLRRLAGLGNTVIVIEHNLEVVAAADWVVDIGPGGGDEGGELVMQGSPAELARCAGSITGRYLAARFGGGER